MYSVLMLLRCNHHLMHCEVEFIPPDLRHRSVMYTPETLNSGLVLPCSKPMLRCYTFPSPQLELAYAEITRQARGG